MARRIAWSKLPRECGEVLARSITVDAAFQDVIDSLTLNVELTTPD